jgi:hypothetical protein
LHAPRAVQITQAFLQDLFGANPDTVLATNAYVMSCQNTVLKSAGKCEDLRINSFNKCKKEGLKRGFVATSVQLQTTCLGNGSIQPDPTGGKIASTCVTVPTAKIEIELHRARRVPRDRLPGCNETTAAGLAAARTSGCAVDLQSPERRRRPCATAISSTTTTTRTRAVPSRRSAVMPTSEQRRMRRRQPSAARRLQPTCTVEPGWSCSGQPSTCARLRRRFGHRW